MSEIVVPLTFVREVPASNLDRDASYADTDLAVIHYRVVILRYVVRPLRTSLIQLQNILTHGRKYVVRQDKQEKCKHACLRDVIMQFM